SRDITGVSTKYVLTKELERFYAALRASTKLKWVHTHSAGLDRPIFGELQARGIEVTASSGANAEIVAHTALAGILSLARRFPQLQQAQTRHEWAPLIGSELPQDLNGQTAVVVGWGPIGRHLARLLGAFGIESIVVRNGPQVVPEVKATVTYDQIKSVLPQADWVILACPLSDRTLKLIDTEALSLMSPAAYLVNVARGEVVDEQAVINALKSRQIAGAFLDVFEKEPLGPDSALWDLDNVIVTPHAAGHSAGNYDRVVDMFVKNLTKWHDREHSAQSVR
ncbi:MAG TPA: D-2-hydroxyacid dehydrogenase, partial [Eoetvoesiella sp.]